MWLYNLGISLYAGGIRLAALWHGKARLWSEGRRNIFERMEAAVRPSDRIVWVHAASLGEFEQARPIIERLRAEHPEYKILLTFFSPSGYEIRKNYEGADYVFYLPADTPSNARRFLDIVHPEIAIFIKYEFWINLLSELRRRKVRSYIVSVIFRRNSVFFRPYGGMWRQALESFDVMFVQNEESKKLLATLLLNQTNPVDLSSLHQQNAVPPRVAEQLCRLLRLAIIFASRRRDDLVPEMTLQANHELLTLTLPQGWLTQHPLGKEIIAQESQWQSYVHWPLEVH